jgi:UDP-N-acetylmuramoyl-tripeptide--D-alanyl-D-alanine ligase
LLYAIFGLISHILFVFVLGWYLINNLQWYNYKFDRVVLKHKKYSWHLLFFIVPIFAYYISGYYFWIYFYLGYLPSFYMWNKKLDKKLVFTARVKRFFIFLIAAAIFQDTLCVVSQKCMLYGVFMPLFATSAVSYLFEKILFEGYKKEAHKKLQSFKDLKIIAITASYGKTSIKNFIYQIISSKYKAYKSPRSVNTLAGLVKDINNELPSNTEVYIAEAGARERGDIRVIAQLLNHHYAVVGSIGPQHIEYFKSLENIRDTKMEILQSKNLLHAFVHKSAIVKPSDNITVFGDNITLKRSDLDGIVFDLEIDGGIYTFECPLLGSFNAINITAAILVCLKIGLNIEEVKKRVKELKPIEHRLQKIEAGGKLIIDDSFNGNLEGMLDSYEIAKSYKGRKVIVTPGIIESTKQMNEKLAQKIDEVFDIAIITSKANASILLSNIKFARKIFLSDKCKLQETLAQETRAGDLILFSNDAPSFI